MSDLDARFAQAAKYLLSLSEAPDNNVKLKLYALYKQASEGDVNGEKPGFFDFVGTAKYEAWGKLKGVASEQAKQDYIALVKKLAG